MLALREAVAHADVLALVIMLAINISFAGDTDVDAARVRLARSLLRPVRLAASLACSLAKRADSC